MKYKIVWHPKYLFLAYSYLILTSSGCGKYPTPLTSARDIKSAPPDTSMIAIADLPPAEYGLLAKFQRLKTIKFYKKGASGPTDADLAALAKIRFPTLEGIILQKCSNVTDSGMAELANIKSLKWLQLDETEISDHSLTIIASQMNLSGLNVARTKVTLSGLAELSHASSLRELEFSSTGEKSQEVCKLFKQCPQIAHVEIDDISGDLNVGDIQQCAKNLGIDLVVRKGEDKD
jgi:hypothetical protein